MEAATREEILKQQDDAIYKRRNAAIEQERIADSFGREAFADEPCGWGDNKLIFVVREPFPSRSTQTEIVYGKLGADDTFQILSQMPENGVVFSDGIESDAIAFNSGTEITVEIAPQKGRLVVA